MAQHQCCALFFLLSFALFILYLLNWMSLCLCVHLPIEVCVRLFICAFRIHIYICVCFNTRNGHCSMYQGFFAFLSRCLYMFLVWIFFLRFVSGQSYFSVWADFSCTHPRPRINTELLFMNVYCLNKFCFGFFRIIRCDCHIAAGAYSCGVPHIQESKQKTCRFFSSTI